MVDLIVHEIVNKFVTNFDVLRTALNRRRQKGKRKVSFVNDEEANKVHAGTRSAMSGRTTQTVLVSHVGSPFPISPTGRSGGEAYLAY